MDFYPQLQHNTARERTALLGTPIVTAALEGRVDRTQYLRFLQRAFHHVRHTPELLRVCDARVPGEQKWLREALAHYIEEETGHHEWILDDIAAAGGDAEAVRASEPDFDTDVMVAYAYDTVTRRNPVGLFGMVYVLEGTSVSLASRLATLLQESLELPASAFTYLRSHGALDVEHIGHFENVVNRLETQADRRSVEDGAKTFFRLYGNVLHGIATEEQA
jgi:pyrroloquinoline quinone (PQQ) biosynthesis protein C